MGGRIPAGKKNVSLSPLFKVYTFEQAGLKFAQINSLKDEVITVITVTPGAQSRLPIRSAAEQQLITVNDEKDRPLGMVTAAASCPCSATVVYQDAIQMIVVVYGSNGEYITSYVLPRTKAPRHQGTERAERAAVAPRRLSLRAQITREPPRGAALSWDLSARAREPVPLIQPGCSVEVPTAIAVTVSKSLVQAS